VDSRNVDANDLNGRNVLATLQDHPFCLFLQLDLGRVQYGRGSTTKVLIRPDTQVPPDVRSRLCS
jgi:hypothetical protein